MHSPQKALGSARQSTVLWLLDALDPRQAPTTRAKAVKALGAVVEAEPSVLELADVQRAVERALQVGAPVGCWTVAVGPVDSSAAAAAAGEL